MKKKRVMFSGMARFFIMQHHPYREFSRQLVHAGWQCLSCVTICSCMKRAIPKTGWPFGDCRIAIGYFPTISKALKK